MFLDGDSAHPSAGKLLKQPWWAEHIDNLSGLEIVPCRFWGYDDKGREIVKPCAPERVSIWAVYGHYSPDGRGLTLKLLDDFETKGEAQRFYNKLIDHFPHLARRRARMRPPFQRQSSPPSLHL